MQRDTQQRLLGGAITGMPGTDGGRGPSHDGGDGRGASLGEGATPEQRQQPLLIRMMQQAMRQQQYVSSGEGMRPEQQPLATFQMQWGVQQQQQQGLRGMPMATPRVNGWGLSNGEQMRPELQELQRLLLQHKKEQEMLHHYCQSLLRFMSNGEQLRPELLQQLGQQLLRHQKEREALQYYHRSLLHGQITQQAPPPSALVVVAEAAKNGNGAVPGNEEGSPRDPEEPQRTDAAEMDAPGLPRASAGEDETDGVRLSFDDVEERADILAHCFYSSLLHLGVDDGEGDEILAAIAAEISTRGANREDRARPDSALKSDTEEGCRSAASGLDLKFAAIAPPELERRGAASEAELRRAKELESTSGSNASADGGRARAAREATATSEETTGARPETNGGKRAAATTNGDDDSEANGKSKRRKRGAEVDPPWTEEEVRLYARGVGRHRVDNWGGIAREYQIRHFARFLSDDEELVRSLSSMERRRDSNAPDVAGKRARIRQSRAAASDGGSVEGGVAEAFVGNCDRVEKGTTRDGERTARKRMARDKFDTGDLDNMQKIKVVPLPSGENEDAAPGTSIRGRIGLPCSNESYTPQMIDENEEKHFSALLAKTVELLEQKRGCSIGIVRPRTDRVRK